MTRSRTSFLVSDRNAPLISFSRPSNWPPSRSTPRALTRSVLGIPVLLAGDRERLGQVVGDLAGQRVVDVLLVVEEDGELRNLLGGARRYLPLSPRRGP